MARPRRLLAVLSFGAGVAADSGMSFTVYSQPVRLRYGQVYNDLQHNASAPNLLPQDVVSRYAPGDKSMAMTGFDVDMVRRDASGAEVQVTLGDHYLHHYVLYFGERQAMDDLAKAVSEGFHQAHMLKGCHAMKGTGVQMMRKLARAKGPAGRKAVEFGSAAGAEYRHNPQRFQEPYRVLLHRPEVWAPTLHIINTNSADNSTEARGYVSPLLECPCTPQRRFDLAAGTIDGRPASPPIRCSPEFEATGNPSCHLETYVGGWRCCENNVFLVDTDKECKDPLCSEKPVDEVIMKFTFYYEDAHPAVRRLERGACCDVTSDTQGFENIEYDIPKCRDGTPAEQCVHVAESLQPVAYFDDGEADHAGSDLVDLVFVAPHLHWAAISITLVDPATNRTLCEVRRTADNSRGLFYGHGTAPGEEDGYLTGLIPCSWSGKDAPRFRRDHKLFTRAVYDASSPHTGVMGLWLSEVSPVEADFVV